MIKREEKHKIEKIFLKLIRHPKIIVKAIG